MNELSLQEVVDLGVKLTPMMSQYYEIKKNYKDIIVFFRMGDFYEVFFEDARSASKLLNITLTNRGKLGGYPIPMAGIPHHAATTYIDRLTAIGLKVAICEQVENPKEAKGIVKRAVTQVVSPGMPFDLEKAEQREHRYIACGHHHRGHFYLILLDFTTGDFVGHKFETQTQFLEYIKLSRPKEFITFLGQWDEHKLISEHIEKNDQILVTHLSIEYFNVKEGGIYIEKFIPTYKFDHTIKSHKEILCPMSAISYYVCSTQPLEELVHLRPFRMEGSKKKMKVTMQTLIGLEIYPKSRLEYKNSLLGFVDKTRSAMGSRELSKLFTSPLRDIKEITSRQSVVEFLSTNEALQDYLRDELSNVRDLERIMAKVSTKKVTASDLINLSKSVSSYTAIDKKISSLKKLSLENLELELTKPHKSGLLKLSATIDETINDEIGAALEKGNLIRKGANKKRDRLARLSQNCSSEILNLEEKYRKKTGISKLKIKHNGVNGYFIEVSKTQTSKIPNSFDRRQTLVNSERYITKELLEFEKEVIAAEEKLEKLERSIFSDIVGSVKENREAILSLSKLLALLDIFQSLTHVALQEDFTRPKIYPNKQIQKVKGGFHPIIKAGLRDGFICHDLNLSSDCHFGLITGPNMAGKTTVMREMSIIQFLAQIGSYVPADSAELGICDALYSRLGASDNILEGQSTFMVEMAETAEILRHATSRSLIVLDEVGRGTSTYDGLSIAWSLVECFVRKTKALTLFSTHYHELIELVENLESAKNLTVETLEQNGDVEFLYRLVEKSTDQSFGIYVAKLAGIPNDVLLRSSEILSQMEKAHGRSDGSQTVYREELSPEGIQLSFLEQEVSQPKVIVPAYLLELEDTIKEMDVLNMTPIEALQKLHYLKKQLTGFEESFAFH